MWVVVVVVVVMVVVIVVVMVMVMVVGGSSGLWGVVCVHITAAPY